MHIWNQLTLPATRSRGYFKMIGNTTSLLSSLTLHSPMSMDLVMPTLPVRCALLATPFPRPPFTFLFSSGTARNPGLALPLIALQYHEVKINLDLRPIDECLWAVTDLTAVLGQGAKTATMPTTSPLLPLPSTLTTSSLTPTSVADAPRTPTSTSSTSSSSLVTSPSVLPPTRSSSTSTTPCKELIWVVQPDANVDYCSSSICDTTLSSSSVPSLSTTLMPSMPFPTLFTPFGSEWGSRVLMVHER